MVLTLEEGMKLLDQWRWRQSLHGHWRDEGNYVGEALLGCRFPGEPEEGFMELAHLVTDSGVARLWIEVYASEDDNPDPVVVDAEHLIAALFKAGLTPEMFREQWNRVNAPALPLASDPHRKEKR